MLEQAVIGCLNSDQATTSNAASSANKSQEDESDFFNFTSVSTLPSQKHLELLKDKKKELTMLDHHPIIKQLFIRYNKCKPSSAPVERPFSAASLVLTKRRNRLSDTLFETLLMLKINKHYWWLSGNCHWLRRYWTVTIILHMFSATLLYMKLFTTLSSVDVLN